MTLTPFMLHLEDGTRYIFQSAYPSLMELLDLFSNCPPDEMVVFHQTRLYPSYEEPIDFAIKYKHVKAITAIQDIY